MSVLSVMLEKKKNHCSHKTTLIHRQLLILGAGSSKPLTFVSACLCGQRRLLRSTGNVIIRFIEKKTRFYSRVFCFFFSPLVVFLLPHDLSPTTAVRDGVQNQYLCDIDALKIAIYLAKWQINRSRFPVVWAPARCKWNAFVVLRRKTRALFAYKNRCRGPR